MTNQVVYIFLNKSLQMSVGKAAAQAAHAAAYCDFEPLSKNPHRTIIVLEARDEAHMISIENYLMNRDVNVFKVVDEGVNEILPQTLTAMCTPVLDKNDEKLQLTMSTFKLYRDTVRLSIEVDR